MSSAGNTLGTQSPPLDATAGQNAPMGVSNIQGDKPDAVPDSKQREQYFDGSQSAQGKDKNATEQSWVHLILDFFFLIGAATPITTRLIQYKVHNTLIRYLHWPLIFSSTGLIPPATPTNYIIWCFVGFIFNYAIHRRHFAWWTKYNYVLSAALDSGTALASIIVFFYLQYPQKGMIGIDTIQAWWGNIVFAETADYKREPFYKLAVNQTFGPVTW